MFRLSSVCCLILWVWLIQQRMSHLKEIKSFMALKYIYTLLSSAWKWLWKAETCNWNFHVCTVHSANIKYFIYPTDAQLNCSKNVKIYITIYMRGAATCFGFSQPSSGSYYMCFVEVIILITTYFNWLLISWWLVGRAF